MTRWSAEFALKSSVLPFPMGRKRLTSSYTSYPDICEPSPQNWPWHFQQHLFHLNLHPIKLVLMFFNMSHLNAELTHDIFTSSFILPRMEPLASSKILSFYRSSTLWVQPYSAPHSTGTKMEVINVDGAGTHGNIGLAKSISSISLHTQKGHPNYVLQGRSCIKLNETIIVWPFMTNKH